MSPRALDELRIAAHEAPELRPVQLVLVGTDVLRDVLASNRLWLLDGQAVTTIEMRAIPPGEVGPYVIERLAGSDDGDWLPIGLGVPRLMGQMTGGWPGALNLLADRAQLLAQLGSARAIDESLVASAARMLGWTPPRQTSLLDGVVAAPVGVGLLLAGAAMAVWLFG